MGSSVPPICAQTIAGWSQRLAVGLEYGSAVLAAGQRRTRTASLSGSSIEPFDFCETDGREHPGSLFGFTLENAGDVDNDGFEDLLVGAPGFEHDTSDNMKGPGAVYLFWGGDGL